MSAQLYHVYNGASAAAAGPVKLATGTAIKTHLQILNPSTSLRVVEWGVSFDAITSQTPFLVELCSTGTVAATVTAFAANDITEFSSPTSNVPQLTLSTSGSGYNASNEGTVIAPVRKGDEQLVAVTNQYVKQFPLGREFEVQATHNLRIRITPPSGATTVNALCYVIFESG